MLNPTMRDDEQREICKQVNSIYEMQNYVCSEAWDVTQWITHWLCKQEALSLHPQHSTGHGGNAFVTPVLEEGSGAHWPAILAISLLGPHAA